MDLKIQENNKSFSNNIKKDIELTYFDLPQFIPLTNFIGRNDDLREFKEIYLNHNFICIDGIMGIGKTEFLKYFLSSILDKNSKIGWFKYINNLKDTLINTKEIFLDSELLYEDIHIELKYKAVLKYISELDKNYVLVFDNVTNINNDDMNFMITLKCKVIIISRYSFEKYKNCIKTYTMKFIPPETTKHIFEYYYYNKIKKEEIEALNQILELSGYHTLIIELLAKLCNNCKFSIYDLYQKLKTYNFNISGIQTLSKHEFDNEEKFFIKNLLKIYNILEENENEKQLTFISELEKIYNNVAFTYNKLNKYELSLEYYKKAIKIIEENLKENDNNTENIEKAYNNTALVYKELGQYNEALKYYKKILELKEKNSEKDYIPLDEIYNNIAACYNNLLKHKLALEYNEKALNVNEKNLQKKHFNKIEIYKIAALIHNNLGIYNRALEYCEKTSKIIEETLGKEHIKLAEIYNCFGIIYKNLGIHDLTLEYYQKALSIREKELGMENLTIVNSYDLLALLFANCAKYNMAIKYNEKALNIEEKELGIENLSTASLYSRKAEIYGMIQKYDVSLEYYKKALIIQKNILGKEHLYTAVTYHNISYTYNKIHKYEIALKYNEKALNICKDSVEDDNFLILLIKNNKCNIINSMKKNKNIFKNFFEYINNLLNSKKK